MMATFDRELKLFDLELNRNFQKIIAFNRCRSFNHKNIKTRSQAQNDIVLGSEYLDLTSRSDLQYNGVDLQSVGNIIPSPPDDYSMELNKYFNFDSNVAASPGNDDLDTRRNQSLDDFFHDFNEIISSEIKATSTPTTTTPYGQGHHCAATNLIPYNNNNNNNSSSSSDQSNAYTGTVDFNLDLTQFYINTNESDFLNSDELKSDFTSNEMVQFPSSSSQYSDKAVADQIAFSVIDHSNGNAQMHGSGKYNVSSSDCAIVDDQMEFSVTDVQPSNYYDESSTKISVSTPLNQFYLDFKVNGEVTSGSNDDNSVVTYISKDSLQSVEYINERGQTETVVYVDQQSDGDKNGGGVTQYEIINFDEYQYQTGNGDSQPPQNNNNNNNDGLVEMNVPTYSDNGDIGQQTDILSTLLSDKSNKIVIIAKPLRNPKVRPQPNDEFHMKFDAIDNNPTQISFAKPVRVKGCRKQKFEMINQIEVDFVETKSKRPKTVETITATTSTELAETPKLPSKFMKERRSKVQVMSRKRPRKLCWDSESDCENEKKIQRQLNV